MSDYADEIAARIMPACLTCYENGQWDLACAFCCGTNTRHIVAREDLARIIREAVTAEREACAQICVDLASLYTDMKCIECRAESFGEEAANECAELIRERGTK